MVTNHNRDPYKAVEGRKSMFGMDFYDCLDSARRRARSAHRTTAIFMVAGDYFHTALFSVSERNQFYEAKVDSAGWAVLKDGRILNPSEALLPLAVEEDEDSW